MRTTHSHAPIRHDDAENTPEATKTSVVEKLERCSFCNTKLLFSHDLNLSYLQVVESSRCPGCGVTMRPKTFTLH